MAIHQLISKFWGPSSRAEDLGNSKEAVNGFHQSSNYLPELTFCCPEVSYWSRSCFIHNTDLPRQKWNAIRPSFSHLTYSVPQALILVPGAELSGRYPRLFRGLLGLSRTLYICTQHRPRGRTKFLSDIQVSLVLLRQCPTSDSYQDPLIIRKLAIKRLSLIHCSSKSISSFSGNWPRREWT